MKMKKLLFFISLIAFYVPAQASVVTYTLPAGTYFIPESAPFLGVFYWDCGLKTDTSPLLPSSSYPNKSLNGFTIQNSSEDVPAGSAGNVATAYDDHQMTSSDFNNGKIVFSAYNMNIAYNDGTQIPQNTYLVCDFAASIGRGPERVSFSAGNHHYFKVVPTPSASVSVIPSTIQLSGFVQGGKMSHSTTVYYTGCNGHGSFTKKITPADNGSALYQEKLTVTLPTRTIDTCTSQQDKIGVSFDPSNVPAGKYSYTVNIYYTVN